MDSKKDKRVVQQVLEWASENFERLGALSSKVWLRFMAPTESSGKVALELKTANKLASFAFWNTEEVCAQILDESAKEPRVLDDRKLTDNESVRALLETYVSKIS